MTKIVEFPLPVIVLLAVQLMGGCQTAGGGKGWVQYPEDTTPYPSPNGKWRIENEGTYEADARHLYLVNATNADKSELLEYYRNAFVKWSPSGDKLLVNVDLSSEMTPWIFMPGLGTKIDLREEFLDSPYAGLVENAVHWYAEGTEWRGDSRVRINVFGHGGGEFSKWYCYDLVKGGFLPD